MAHPRNALVRIPPPSAPCAHLPLPQWAGGRDEYVEVNQRALIDKILARYSGEFTSEPRPAPHILLSAR